MTTCPICAYPDLDEDGTHLGEICPCCGMEFGLDDEDVSHRELRDRWLKAGAPWFSDATEPPSGWNAVHQLRAGQLEFTPAQRVV